MNRKYTEEHIAYIAANIPGRPFRDLTSLFNARFGMSLTVSTMVSLSARHGLHNGRDTKILPDGSALGKKTQFKKGIVPWNKGIKGICYEGNKVSQFPKGHKAANCVAIGTERVNSDGYVDVKVVDGRKQHNWKGKHILIWEAAHGPVPPGHAVIFGDRDNRNFDLDNLLLVTRGQLATLNKLGLIQNDVELTKSGIIIADIHHKIGERKKGRSDRNA